jgi:hypothetical protein
MEDRRELHFNFSEPFSPWLYVLNYYMLI